MSERFYLRDKMTTNDQRNLSQLMNVGILVVSIMDTYNFLDEPNWYTIDLPWIHDIPRIARICVKTPELEVTFARSTFREPLNSFLSSHANCFAFVLSDSLYLNQEGRVNPLSAHWYAFANWILNSCFNWLYPLSLSKRPSYYLLQVNTCISTMKIE